MDEWHQFYEINPFGPWRDNYHAAVIADVLAQVNGNKLPMSNWFYKDQETVIEERKARDYATFKSIVEIVKAQK